jgi:hypothetical protein
MTVTSDLRESIAREKEVTSMRGIKLVFAMIAMMALMTLIAAPALARHDHDGWRDDCDWFWSPRWGYYLACEVDDDWRKHAPRWHWYPSSWWWHPWWGWWHPWWGYH